jgi:hypothetical protein
MNEDKKVSVIDKVIAQIKTDLEGGDVSALAEMLCFLPIENLIAYLPEENL